MSSNSEFKKVYKEFHPKILRYVTRLTGDREAEDITQEAFEKVSGGLKNFRGKSSLSTWVYRVATNTALDRMKSPSFKQTFEDLSDDPEDKNIWTSHKKAPVDQQLIRKEMSSCIREHIDKLHPDYRTVILLSEIEGFKNIEIADILQVSLDTVKIRLHRSRASLKKILDEACDFYHNEQNILACDRKPLISKFKKSD